MGNLLASLIFLLLSGGVGFANTPTPPPLPREKTYMPQVFRPRLPPQMGAQDETKTLHSMLPKGTYYHVNVRWDQIEPSAGNYKWDAVLDREIARAKARGLKVIIGTRASPKWARQRTDYVCSQPRPGNYDEYAWFVVQLAKRYQPWGVEIWNEPDVKYEDVSKDWWIMGCWETPQQYADLVRVVVDKMNQSGVDTKVLGGALALEDERGYLFARDLRGIPNFITFHAYAYWGDDFSVIEEKVWSLRSRGVNDALIISETSYLDTTSQCLDRFEKLKAEYASYVRDGAKGWGLDGVLWYTIGGNNWRCSDLTGESYNQWFK